MAKNIGFSIKWFGGMKDCKFLIFYLNISMSVDLEAAFCYRKLWDLKIFEIKFDLSNPVHFLDNERFCIP